MKRVSLLFTSKFSSPRFRGVSVGAATLAAALAGCSSDSDTPPKVADEIVTEAFPSTIELATADLAALDSSLEDGTLHFRSPPASLGRVDVGSVIVGGVSAKSPKGLLRGVMAVERNGDELTLKTGQVPIQVAYKKIHARLARTTAVVVPPSSGAGTNGLKAPGLKPQGVGGRFDETQPFNYVLFDGDGDTRTTNDQIVVDGAIGGGFDYEFGLDVDWGGVNALPDVVSSCLKSLAKVVVGQKPDCSLEALLPEAKVSFVVDPQVHANANIHGAAILEYEKEVDLASTTLPPIILGPLVFIPAVDLTAQLKGGASASFTTGVHGSAVFETSVTVSSRTTKAPDFHPPVLKSTDFGPNETSISLHANAKVGAGARLNLLLFGITGPYANAQAYAAVDADILKTPCWSLHAGIDLDLGIRVTSPALPLLGHVTLVDWQAARINPLDVELNTGACSPPPNPPMLPPGSGPDGVHLAQPTFTPWSRTLSSPAAPVEGGVANSPGNSVLFGDTQRAIDGHYVRAGYGVITLTKMSGDGSLVWARDLSFDNATLRPLRVRPTSDGAMLVLSTAVTAPIVLTKVAQDGSVLQARAFDIPFDTCIVEPVSLTTDGSGGHFVAGSCVGRPKSFLLHVEKYGNARLWLLDPNEINAFRARVVENIDGDAFVSGTMNEGTDTLFAMRIKGDGTVVYSKKYTGCNAAPDIIPSAAIVGKLGEVTLAGSGGAQHNGSLIRLREDGSVGFASFPGFGFGVGSVFLLDSIAELPTTGYVAGASSVRFTSEGNDDVPSAGLVGFDGAGKIIWAKRYLLNSPTGFESSGAVGVRLSDDGGIFASALVADSADPLHGRLWNFKPFAKDGDVPFTDRAATIEPLAISNLECSLSAADRSVAVVESPITGRSVAVSSSAPSPAIAKQTTN